jgi:hypothetical protein
MYMSLFSAVPPISLLIVVGSSSPVIHKPSLIETETNKCQMIQTHVAKAR